MNNKIVSTKTTSAIFLAIVLVTGTITLSSHSLFMTETQAQPYYNEMDTNNYKKSKDSNSKSININKIKCINDNISVNGNNAGNVSIGNKGRIAEEGYRGIYSPGSSGYGNERYYDYGYDNKRDKGVDCIINNNNNIEQINPPSDIQDESNLVVNKDVSCQPGDNNFLSARACLDLNAGAPDAQPRITPDNFTITVTGNNPIPSQFEGSIIPVIVNLGIGDYQVSETADSSVATTITSIEQANGVDITQSVLFSGDCDALTGEGTIEEGEIQICHVQNVFTPTALPPG